MQKKPKSTQERPVPKIEAKEPFTTASAHTAVRNGFCIRLGQPWDAKVPKYTAKNGTAWCRWAWLGLAGRGLARPGMLLSLKDAKENPDHHRRPSTGGGLLFCPLESPGASPRCPPGPCRAAKTQKFGHWRAGMAFFEDYSATAWQRHGSPTVSRRIRKPLASKRISRSATATTRRPMKRPCNHCRNCDEVYSGRAAGECLAISRDARRRFASTITLHASVPLSSRLSINALASASIPGRAASCLTKCLARSASHSWSDQNRHLAQ